MTQKHPVFDRHPMHYDPVSPRVLILRVIDGDTVDCLVDHGFRQYSVQRIRLRDIDAPEIRGEERPEGIAAKEEVERLVWEAGGYAFLLRIDHDHTTFGRFVAVLVLNHPKGHLDVGLHLVRSGLASPVPFGIYGYER